MINIINRFDNEEGVDASHSRGMRFWSPSWVKREMDKLARLGVKTLRISDEMFFLNRKYYTPILENCISKIIGLTCGPTHVLTRSAPRLLSYLNLLGSIGSLLELKQEIKEYVRKFQKGTFREINIRDVCNTISNSDIKIISNYIFGFPDDTRETMKQTLDLALELNTEMANMYPCQALPGSPLYNTAKKGRVVITLFP